MTYSEEMLKYMNKDTGLFGYMPNEAGFSTGNPLLDTGTAYVMLNDQSLEDTNGTSLKLTVYKCFPTGQHYIAKIPGTLDKISHDDLIGIVAGLAVTDEIECIKDLVIEEGRELDWILSTTGEFYWDALVKPWHKAYYLMAAGLVPWVGGRVMLAASILLDALFNKDSTSDKKLIWLMYKTVMGRSKIVDFAFKIWHKRLIKVFGSMKKVFEIYYGPDHLFTRYCSE